MTRTATRTTHTALASAGAIGLAVTGIIGPELSANPTARTAATTSSACHISVTADDPVSATPLASIDHAVRTAPSSAWSRDSAAHAEAPVGALPLRDKPISDQCVEGKTRYDHSRSTSPPPDTQFSYRGSPQITVRTVDAGTVAAETIAVATAEHGPNTPPATGPTAPPGRPPATSPADNQLSSDTPGGTSDQPAPKPTPRVGHHPVTG